MSLDEVILRAIYASGAPPITYAMLGLTALGSGWTTLILLPLLSLPKARRHIGEFAFVVATVSLAVWLLKLGVGRVRPCYALSDVRALYIFVRAPSGPSCPSGHAAGAFAVATYVNTRFRSAVSKSWGAALYGLAALIGLSRVYLGVHYPSDVFLGAVLGTAMGWALTRLAQRLGARAP